MMTMQKLGPNRWGMEGGGILSLEVGRPTLWQRFKMRLLPKLWERECDEEMDAIARLADVRIEPPTTDSSEGAP